MPPPLTQLPLLPANILRTGVSHLQRPRKGARTRRIWGRCSERTVRPRKRIDGIHLIRKAPQPPPQRPSKSSTFRRLVPKRARRPTILQQRSSNARCQRQKPFPQLRPRKRRVRQPRQDPRKLHGSARPSVGKPLHQDLKNQLDQAAATLSAAQAQHVEATRDYERAKTLYASESLTKPDFDRAQAKFDSTLAAVDQAKANAHQ